jgi:hypothetical protein
MVEQDPSEAETRDGSLYLVGVRLDPGRGEPDLYTLILLYEGETVAKDRPLTQDGYIVWFASRSQAASALLLGDAEFRKHMSAPDEVSAIYDFAQVIFSWIWWKHPGFLSLKGTLHFFLNALII